MDARRKIEAALKGFVWCPKWHETNPDDVVHAVRNDNARIVADVGYSGCEDFDKIICAYIAAVCPANISELLATHTAEMAAREAEIARLRRIADLVTSAVVYRSEKDWQLMNMDLSEAAELAKSLTQQPTKD